MIVEAETAGVAEAIFSLASTVRTNDGFVSETFIVRESGGQFHAAVDQRREPQGRVLVEYAPEIRPRIYAVDWADDADALVPTAGLETLSQVQAQVLEAWLSLINATGRLAHVRRQLPALACADWALRHHLASGGHPEIRKPPTLAAAMDTVIAWHSGASSDHQERAREEQLNVASAAARSIGALIPDNRRHRWHLIPLKCFVNHHPDGAAQRPIPGKIAVAAATPTDTDETFENYGDLDAFQLLMNFGYLDNAAPLVHSVPVEIESAHLGRVVVRWRAPRNPRGGAIARDVPMLRPTDEGLELRHLTARPGNRERVASFLAMAARARAGLSPSNARAEAEAMIDAIAQANLDYYRRLDELVVEAMATPAPPIVEGFGTPEILPTIASMSLLQQQRLGRFWGS